jgi:hypothetical protein
VQRLAVLQPYVPQARQIVEQALASYPRRILARDDIVDALVLALSAAMPPERLASLPALPPRDAHGLPMGIVYPFFALPKIGRAKKMTTSASGLSACKEIDFKIPPTPFDKGGGGGFEPPTSLHIRLAPRATICFPL